MSIFKKSTVIAALFSVVIIGLSACGGDDSDAGNAEELRGVVKDVASKAKSTAETAVDRVEDKIKEPASGTDDE
jgi:hypothetical protein